MSDLQVVPAFSVKEAVVVEDGAGDAALGRAVEDALKASPIAQALVRGVGYPERPEDETPSDRLGFREVPEDGPRYAGMSERQSIALAAFDAGVSFTRRDWLLHLDAAITDAQDAYEEAELRGVKQAMREQIDALQGFRYRMVGQSLPEPSAGG